MFDDKDLHLDKPIELPSWTIRLCETVYDITLNAQRMSEAGRIEAEDSRELFSSILWWAREFEEKHPEPWDNGDDEVIDYIELIDEFAEKKLIETYGKEC